MAAKKSRPVPKTKAKKTAKAKKTVKAKKTAKAKKTVKAKKTAKQSKPKPKRTLDDLVKQAMTDEAFVRDLEKSPARALKKHGYPADAKLVAQIRGIKFSVFREAFPRKPSVAWC
jgi:hypothetical protein